jgi:hypothetical protein
MIGSGERTNSSREPPAPREGSRRVTAEMQLEVTLQAARRVAAARRKE